MKLTVLKASCYPVLSLVTLLATSQPALGGDKNWGTRLIPPKLTEEVRKNEKSRMRGQPDRAVSGRKSENGKQVRGTVGNSRGFETHSGRFKLRGTITTGQ